MPFEININDELLESVTEHQKGSGRNKAVIISNDVPIHVRKGTGGAGAGTDRSTTERRIDI